MKKIFFTGFPGFIGTRLVRELLRRDRELEVIALIKQRLLHAAEAGRSQISKEVPGSSKRIQIVLGDIIQDDLGIPDVDSITHEITGIFHLAAANDPAVARQDGMALNVEGTRNIIEFAKQCRNLKRLDYVSTAYVSGKVRGKFSEDDFDQGQDFKNYFEETKFLAEKVVRSANQFPVAIYRLGFVVGDSRTGETAKYDGPYYLLQAMKSLPNLFPFPKFGHGSVEVNLVPVNFVADALAVLSAENGSLNNTYHLTDPSPLRVSELQSMFAKSLGKRFINYPFPASLMKKMLATSFMRKIYGVPSQMIDYFVHDVHYESTSTTDALRKLGVVCPSFKDYFYNLLNYFQSHSLKELQGVLI